jgi:hypothetical protein
LLCCAGHKTDSRGRGRMNKMLIAALLAMAGTAQAADQT